MQSVSDGGGGGITQVLRGLTQVLEIVHVWYAVSGLRYSRLYLQSSPPYGFQVFCLPTKTRQRFNANYQP